MWHPADYVKRLTTFYLNKIIIKTFVLIVFLKLNWRIYGGCLQAYFLRSSKMAAVTMLFTASMKILKKNLVVLLEGKYFYMNITFKYEVS